MITLQCKEAFFTSLFGENSVVQMNKGGKFLKKL